jgi:hypothetical protein
MTTDLRVNGHWHMSQPERQMTSADPAVLPVQNLSREKSSLKTSPELPALLLCGAGRADQDRPGVSTGARPGASTIDMKHYYVDLDAGMDFRSPKEIDELHAELFFMLDKVSHPDTISYRTTDDHGAPIGFHQKGKGIRRKFEKFKQAGA